MNEDAFEVIEKKSDTFREAFHRGRLRQPSSFSRVSQEVMDASIHCNLMGSCCSNQSSLAASIEKPPI